MARSSLRLFIGSSSQKGQPVADNIQALLQPYCRAEVWNQSTFGLGKTALQDLQRVAGSFDFAVLVLAADDLTIQGGEAAASVRDNILFELGLFIGALGSERTYMAWCTDDPPKIPTDLLGVTAATYPAASGADLRAALGPATLKIREAMELAGPRRQLLGEKGRTLHALMTRDIRRLAQELHVSEDDIGVHIWLLDTAAEPPVMQRALRVRSGTAPATSRFSHWKRSEGIVGTAWNDDDDVWMDFGDGPLQDIDESSFEALPASSKVGTDWKTFERSRRYFRVVYAVPMQDKTYTPVGVLSVNVDRDLSSPNAELIGVLRRASREMAYTCRLVLGLD